MSKKLTHVRQVRPPAGALALYSKVSTWETFRKVSGKFPETFPIPITSGRTIFHKKVGVEKLLVV
jgi:hypothetical protein